MSGKFGDLSPEQAKALDQFRSAVDGDHSRYQASHSEKIAKFTAEETAKEKASTVPPEEKKDEDETLKDSSKLTDAQRKEEYDRELTRFLRAFKWKVDQAVPHYKKYLLFKEKYSLDYLINFPLLFSPPKIELLQKLVPHGVHGYDKEGCPVYIEKAGLSHTTALLQNFTEEEILLNHLWNQEKLVRKCLHQNRINGYYYSPSPPSTSGDSSKPESSSSLSQDELGKKHVEQFVNVLDLKGLHLGHRSCLKYTKVILTTDQAFYPERLKKMFIVNAPWIFPVLWNIVKHWLDPVTREKIVVLKGNYKEELLKHIDANQLPAEYGGKCSACPSSPDCIPTHDISDIIKSLKEESEELELTTVKIPAGKKFIHKLEGAKETVFGWYFKTIGHDINFSVEFLPRSASPAEKITVVEAQRWSAEEMGHQGTWTATCDGTCYFIFDNSFSWMKGKEVRYNITAGEIERSLSKRNSVSNLSIHEKSHNNNNNNNNEKEESKSKNDTNGKNEAS